MARAAPVVPTSSRFDGLPVQSDLVSRILHQVWQCDFLRRANLNVIEHFRDSVSGLCHPDYGVKFFLRRRAPESYRSMVAEHVDFASVGRYAAHARAYTLLNHSVRWDFRILVRQEL